MGFCDFCRQNHTNFEDAAIIGAGLQEIGAMAEPAPFLTDGIKQCRARAILSVDDMSEMGYFP
jgi:hypothetical protein